MIPVTIPTTDVNSESALILRWYVEDRVEVRQGETLAEVETSKAILDVEAPEAGLLLRIGAVGDQLMLDQPLGYLFESLEALERYERERIEEPAGDAAAERVTLPARRRAAELGVDVDALAQNTDQLITTKLVEAAARSTPELGGSLEPLAAPAGVRRLVIIGAGLGSTQVLDILRHDPEQQAVAIVDDDLARLGEWVDGVPVLGGLDRALELFAQQALDAAVISISTSVVARTRLRERCEQAGLPLANAIDPTARIADDVRIGVGNVICANCHFGVGTVVGENNFISAYNSFDHHSVLGSDISTGPGCMTSGLVQIGDRCRLGTGIFIEPKVMLGTGVQVASGSVIVASVPSDHAVKTKVVSTAVVPIRRS